jgi:hypothetical protein
MDNHLRHFSNNLYVSSKIQMLLIAVFSILLVAVKPVNAQKNGHKKGHKRNKYKLPYLANIKTAKEIAEIYNKFERFKYQIMGHFSNKEQVDSGASFDPLQEYVVMPIFPSRPDEFWVYMEFFSPDLLESPVDQRIEQYVQLSRDTFRMEVYYIKADKQPEYINAWRNEEFPATDIHQDLIRDEGCDLLIVHQKDKPGTYRSIPPEKRTCEMLNAKGSARYVDMEFELNDSQYLMWFHFYGHNQEHLKKTNNNGLIFKRLKEEEMVHMWTKS